MKRSRQVPATLVVALASGLSVSGCGPRSYDECVDWTGVVVDDSACVANAPNVHWVHHYVESGGFGSSGYHGGGGGFFGG